MCYTILLSTTSTQDLSVYNSDLVRWSRNVFNAPMLDQLQYPHHWYLGSQSGCSCTFRHLHSVDLGFGEPVDWYPEDPTELAATKLVTQQIRQLVLRGESVDCIDVWVGNLDLPTVLNQLDVHLNQISDSAFRFFENYHFVFTATDPTEAGNPR